MGTMLFDTAAQHGLQFPQSLTELYKPKSISDFVGLSKVKKICSAFAANPREACLLFVGEPGCGKSSMSRAIAAQIGAEVHAVSSAECKLDVLENLARICSYVPLSGGWHVCILEEGDCMSDAASKWLLSRLDGTNPCPRTVWIITCNSTDRLEERLTSRCLNIRFDSYGAGSETLALLERIWEEQAPAGAEKPADMKRLCSKNIRQAIQNIELEIMAAS
jgi:replication-associated recombination protein RarA